MNEVQPRILIADDDPNVIAALRLLLKSEQFQVNTVSTPFELLQQVERISFSCILIDLNYQKDTTSGQEGLELLKAIKQIDEQVPIIVMTGYSSVEIAVQAMKLGAVDFVQKPWRNSELLATIHAQIRIHNIEQKGRRLEQENALLKHSAALERHDIIARSVAMTSVLAQLEKLAQSDMNILLTGENGTGKSMLASYMHQCSTRASHAFIPVNMGAITETLFESEMFGHVKGAFTDAKDERIGRFELADAGTIFLDEIANIPLSQQVKLLRVLEERQFEKVGSAKTLAVNVRVVSATNADLAQMVTNGDFRQDLLYRLNTVVLHVPALRERIEDIRALADHFCTLFCEKYRLAAKQFSEAAYRCLEGYGWPGNIREFSHVIERSLFLATTTHIHPEDLSLPNCTGDRDTGVDFQHATLADIERTVIAQRLARFDHNAQSTAESLGLSRSAYYRRLEKYQLLEN